MRHISKVGDRHPEFEVLHLLFVGFISDFNASLVADEVEFFLSQVLKFLEAHQYIFFPQPPEIQIQLPCYDHSCKVFNAWCINWYFDFQGFQHIVNGIEASNRVKTHEVGNVKKCLWAEKLKLRIFLKQLSKLQQIRGQYIFTSENML